MRNLFYYDVSIGTICLVEEEAYLTDVLLPNELNVSGSANLKETPILKETISQIKEYLSGKRTVFDVPIDLRGTDFQVKVWNALRDIPYGETRSYKEISQVVGSPKAYRAVGAANNKNRVPIVVPCHRVIGSRGDMVGYAGGPELKRFLLEMERRRYRRRG